LRYYHVGQSGDQPEGTMLLTRSPSTVATCVSPSATTTSLVTPSPYSTMMGGGMQVASNSNNNNGVISPVALPPSYVPAFSRQSSLEPGAAPEGIPNSIPTINTQSSYENDAYALAEGQRASPTLHARTINMGSSSSSSMMTLNSNCQHMVTHDGLYRYSQMSGNPSLSASSLPSSGVQQSSPMSMSSVAPSASGRYSPSPSSSSASSTISYGRLVSDNGEMKSAPVIPGVNFVHADMASLAASLPLPSAASPSSPMPMISPSMVHHRSNNSTPASSVPGGIVAVPGIVIDSSGMVNTGPSSALPDHLPLMTTSLSRQRTPTQQSSVRLAGRSSDLSMYAQLDGYDEKKYQQMMQQHTPLSSSASVSSSPSSSHQHQHQHHPLSLSHPLSHTNININNGSYGHSSSNASRSPRNNVPSPVSVDGSTRFSSVEAVLAAANAVGASIAAAQHQQRNEGQSSGSIVMASSSSVLTSSSSISAISDEDRLIADKNAAVMSTIPSSQLMPPPLPRLSSSSSSSLVSNITPSAVSSSMGGEIEGQPSVMVSSGSGGNLGGSGGAGGSGYGMFASSALAGSTDEKLERYQLFLGGMIVGSSQLSTRQQEALARFRTQHSITIDEHYRVE
jgi:hypothetical protein